MTATGRQHSATNGCFREVKNQRPLFGDELEEMSVAFRPTAVIEASAKLPISRTGLPRVLLLGSCRSPPHTLGQVLPVALTA